MMENVTIKDIAMRNAAFEFCGSNPNWKDKTLILGSKCIEQVGLPRKRWGAEFRVLCYDIMSGLVEAQDRETWMELSYKLQGSHRIIVKSLVIGIRIESSYV